MTGMGGSSIPVSAVESVQQDTESDRENLEAAIYSRTSSSSQRFSYSIDEQITRCAAQCEEADWPVKYVLRDEAESGRDTERPHFQQLLEVAEAGQIDVVVFWALDRFCRSLVDLVKTEEQLAEWDVALQSVTEYIDTTTPVGRFNFRNLASAAELESDLTSKRARMGMYGLAKDHRWPNESPPLGYEKLESGKLRILDDEAAQVRRIFHMYLRERSMPAVAHQLNAEDVMTKEDEKWCRQSLGHVLRNGLYVGRYEVAGFEDDVEEYRVMSDRLFETVTDVRYRFQHSKPRMAADRKAAKADRILEAYRQRREAIQ